MTVQEVALYLKKSVSWVYKNWQELGGRKLAGSLLFPSKEDLYELLFRKEEGVALRVAPERDPIHRGLVRDQERGPRGRKQTKGGTDQTSSAEDSAGDADRHGLFNVGKSASGPR
jgi:hypothetical protein